MAKHKNNQTKASKTQTPTHPVAQTIAKTNTDQPITGFKWDGTMDQIHQNVDQKDWPKFNLFDDYIEIHNDDDVDLVDTGDYILHNHQTNHYSSCSAAKYEQDYAS